MDRLDEGCIKFRLHCVRDKPPSGIRSLVHWRNKLYQAGLIGAYPSGIGYGNISVRSEGGFVISGSGTGNHKTASARHFTRVTAYSIEQNAVHCRGPVKASSESLTHAAVYEASPAVMAIVHAHHKGIWDALLGRTSGTAVEAPYGTPEMAREIGRLFRETDMEKRSYFLMGGHEEGLVGFGGCIEEASRVLLELLRVWQRKGEVSTGNR
ncbi:MAG TPA: class II aldolase/adducin family protein [Gammaproteobacteria bacterium]|nr:class II aldolase/adducin family protein [Gammaproteobacteria bacterium]